MISHSQAVEAAKNPLDTMDARLWAQEFMRIFGGDCNERIDEGLMIGWFANAIMKGYDTARHKYEHATQSHEQAAPGGEGWMREFVKELFVNGFGEKADRLVLTTADGKDLGGWCKQAIIDRLAAQCRAVDGWRPIETAPKDGGDYLFYWNEPELGDWFQQGHWSHQLNRFEWDGEVGWAEGLQYKPTHWRPLPGIPSNTHAKE